MESNVWQDFLIRCQQGEVSYCDLARLRRHLSEASDMAWREDKRIYARRLEGAHNQIVDLMQEVVSELVPTTIVHGCC